jgi:hypothetical protein
MAHLMARLCAGSAATTANAAGHQQVLRAPRHQRAVGHLVERHAGVQFPERHARTLRIVNVDVAGAVGDGVREPLAGQHLFGRQLM